MGVRIRTHHLGSTASPTQAHSAQPALGPEPRAECCVSGPGISSYASDPEQAGQSLRGCLEEALALVPEAQHQETTMFLGATAGMRLLR